MLFQAVMNNLILIKTNIMVGAIFKIQGLAFFICHQVFNGWISFFSRFFFSQKKLEGSCPMHNRTLIREPLARQWRESTRGHEVSASGLMSPVLRVFLLLFFQSIQSSTFFFFFLNFFIYEFSTISQHRNIEYWTNPILSNWAVKTQPVKKWSRRSHK